MLAGSWASSPRPSLIYRACLDQLGLLTILFLLTLSKFRLAILKCIVALHPLQVISALSLWCCRCWRASRSRRCLRARDWIGSTSSLLSNKLDAAPHLYPPTYLSQRRGNSLLSSPSVCSRAERRRLPFETLHPLSASKDRKRKRRCSKRLLQTNKRTTSFSDLKVHLHSSVYRTLSRVFQHHIKQQDTRPSHPRQSQIEDLVCRPKKKHR
jgi:hypothetical protein